MAVCSAWSSPGTKVAMTESSSTGSTKSVIPPALMPVDTALQALLAEAAGRVIAERVLLDEADGRVLLDDVHAARDVPPWPNSAMDGYAINSADQGGAALVVSQRIPAGCAPAPLQAGTAARIFTGAPLPEGADAVVMQENCELHTDEFQTSQLLIRQAVVSRENVRERGADVRRGSLLFSAGHRLRAADLGLLAATGVASVRVGKRPVVALVSSGDELVAPGHELGPGQIYNSNAFVLKALLTRLGLQVLDMGTMADSRAETEQKLRRAAAQVDCIISTGGVSAGEEDHVRAALQAMGQLDIWKLAMKPGKPFAFGRLASGRSKAHRTQDVLFFGLPGNPVSAYVTFLILVRPCLLALMGSTQPDLPQQLVAAAFDAAPSGARQQYLRVKLQQRAGEAPQLLLLNDQSSGVSSSLVHADGLAIVPPYTGIAAGQLLRFLSFGDIV